MSSPIVPYISNAILSRSALAWKRRRAERSRKRRDNPHQVTVYLRINDAYSYLLLQVLAQLAQRFPIQYDFRTVLNLQPEMYPAPLLWEKNAFKDGQYLADLYREDFPDLHFPNIAPASTPQRDNEITAQLLHWELQPGYLANALKLFHAYWQADHSAVDALLVPAITQHAECYQHHLAANEALLKHQGHYLSGMLHYAGEWYWGLDRLQYLERRLNELGLGSGNGPAVLFDRAHRAFCTHMTAAQVAAACNPDTSPNTSQTPLEIFFSIRSPYSYLGLVRARQLAEYYRVPMVVKPVLPMVMRRMLVPKTKGFYILRDVKREADQYGIDFGLVADPLGTGVENCYALYEFAQAAGKGLEFLETYARGVWAEGIRSDTRKGLQTLLSRVGLDWHQASSLLAHDSWRLWAQDNLAELYANDLWGVPSFKYGDTRVFGQDRIDCIERAIVRSLA